MLLGGVSPLLKPEEVEDISGLSGDNADCLQSAGITRSPLGQARWAALARQPQAGCYRWKVQQDSSTDSSTLAGKPFTRYNLKLDVCYVKYNFILGSTRPTYFVI